MTDSIEKIIAEMRDAAGDGDEPGFHVGQTIDRWADRLEALLRENVMVPNKPVAFALIDTIGQIRDLKHDEKTAILEASQLERKRVIPLFAAAPSAKPNE